MFEDIQPVQIVLPQFDEPSPSESGGVFDFGGEIGFEERKHRGGRRGSCRVSAYMRGPFRTKRHHVSGYGRSCHPHR